VQEDESLDERVELLLLQGMENDKAIARVLGVSGRRVAAAARRVKRRWRKRLTESEQERARMVAELRFMRHRLWMLAHRAESPSEQAGALKLLLAVLDRQMRLMDETCVVEEGEEDERTRRQIEALVERLDGARTKDGAE